MNNTWTKVKVIGASMGLALLHFAVFTVSYVESEVVSTHTPQVVKQVLAAVLAFPLVSATQLLPSLDLFPVAVVANSSVWGVALVFGLRAATARLRRRHAQVG
jgi:hypothetical protein